MFNIYSVKLADLRQKTHLLTDSAKVFKRVRESEETGIVLAKKRAMEDAFRISCLSPLERRQLYHSLARIYRRIMRLDSRIDAFYMANFGRATLAALIPILALVSSAVHAALAGQTNQAGTSHGDVPSWNFTCSVILGLSLGLIPDVVVSYVRRRRWWRRQKPTLVGPVPLRSRAKEVAPFVGTTILVVPAALLTMVVSALWGYHFEVEPFAGALTVRVGIGFLGALTTAVMQLPLKLTISLVGRGANLMPFDEIIGDHVKLLGDMIEFSSVWVRPDVSRYLLNRFERLARRSERATWAGRRVPFDEPNLRTISRADWHVLASAYRHHRLALARVHDHAEYDRIIQSLLSGLRNMLDNDWSSMLANFSGHKERHYPLKNWLVACLMPAALLGSAALILPYLPPFKDGGASVDGLRITLVAYALIRLVPGQQSVLDLLSDTLDRSNK